MAGIQDFIGSASKALGIDAGAASAGAGGLLDFVKKHVGDVDFGKLAAAVPGAEGLASKAAGGGGSSGGGGLGGVLGGLAGKAEGLLGGAGGAMAALAKSGLSMDKAKSFLEMFVKFLREKLPPDLLKTIAAKVPGLGSLLG